MTAAVDEDRQLAVHEAGHAVIGQALRLVCGQATIEADEDSSASRFIIAFVLLSWSLIPVRSSIWEWC